MEPQKTEEPKWSWEKMNKAGDVIFPDFKIHCKATVIKIVWN